MKVFSFHVSWMHRASERPRASHALASELSLLDIQWYQYDTALALYDVNMKHQRPEKVRAILRPRASHEIRSRRAARAMWKGLAHRATVPCRPSVHVHRTEFRGGRAYLGIARRFRSGRASLHIAQRSRDGRASVHIARRFRGGWPCTARQITD